MEGKVFIFNPENDLALAYGEEGYTAPPAARQLRRDLQMLPVWYCEAGSAVLSQCCEEDSAWLGGLRESFGIEARCIAINHLQNHCCDYRPWGWSRDLRRRLLNECVPAGQLPTAEQIYRWRELSHRRISQRLLRWVCERVVAPMPELPHEAHTVAEVRDYELRHPRCYIKAPWSSSGHGVYRVLEPQSRNFEIWTQGVINRQGSIMCEPALEAVQDFAIEYQCQGGTARQVGYSVFGNDTHSAYSGGIVAHEATLRGIIVEKLGDERLLDAVREAVRQFVEAEIAPSYEGYLGVDMMVYAAEGGERRLNPCIELNLRTTMGVVTALFAQRYLAPGVTGRFVVEQGKEAAAGGPAVIEGGKLLGGTLWLTPRYADSRYTARIDVK